MSGNPQDRSTYQIAVQREDSGRGGSKLLQRLFNENRKVFVSRPINHFPLHEGASKTVFMAGGIGVTPLIAMAHRLHTLGADFELHYSCRSRRAAAYLNDLESVPWCDRVQLHFSDEGSRVNLADVIKHYQPGWHLYTCGPDRYMSSVLTCAEQLGWTHDALHREYFSLPEVPEYVNHPFRMKLKRDGREIAVSAEESASDALIAAGLPVTLKCSDGLCGVCQCKVVAGDVEHRDFVLSKTQQQDTMILCQSRAREPGGVIEIDL
jgi:ferredoxin-NADP reductase